jgi:uncharacterized protein YkwD
MASDSPRLLRGRIARVATTSAGISVAITIGVTVVLSFPVDESARAGPGLEPQPAEEPRDLQSSSTLPYDNLRQTVLRYTNSFREENNVPPLTLSETLNQAAQRYAEDLAQFGDPQHIKEAPEQYAKAAGFPGAIRSHWCEDEAWGHPSASAVEHWKRSATARRQLLDEEATELGIGVAPGKNGYWYFCQMFPASGQHR